MTLTHEPHTATWDTDLSLGNLRSGLSAFPTGVVALAGLADGVPEVMVSSSFGVGISWEPALVSFSAQNSSRTWPRLRRAGAIGVSLLAADQTPLCRQLASREGDRFAGLDVHRSPHDALLIGGSSLWLETRVQGCTAVMSLRRGRTGIRRSAAQCAAGRAEAHTTTPPVRADLSLIHI